mmetsp:Transcript_4546/g.13158  ORF Transcript_4546/g.13158 Transcript_4546/m.13158 type:complete len:252 (+) Transcript_4546:227-982(+)
MLCWGSVRMRYMSSPVSALSSTRIGRRPCNSASISAGLELWNAPLQMKSMWSVLTLPCFVCTTLPSMIGRRSRCTPSLLTLPVERPVRVSTILSISSMKTMPSCSATRTASRATTSDCIARSASCSSIAARASRTFILRFCWRDEAPPPKPRSFLKMESIMMMPFSRGILRPSFGGRSMSTSLSSSCPDRYISRNESSVLRSAWGPSRPSSMRSSAFCAVCAAMRSRSRDRTKVTLTSTRSLTMSSTSRPT